MLGLVVSTIQFYNDLHLDNSLYTICKIYYTHQILKISFNFSTSG